MAAMPAQSHPLAFLEERHIGTDGVDFAGYLVARHSRIRHAGPDSEFGEHIAVAYSASTDADTHLAGSRLREFLLNKLEVSAGCRDLRDTPSD
jgi:hypothetical protein